MVVPSLGETWAQQRSLAALTLTCSATHCAVVKEVKQTRTARAARENSPIGDSAFSACRPGGMLIMVSNQEATRQTCMHGIIRNPLAS